MAQVFLLRHRTHGALFAAKVLSEQLAADPAVAVCPVPAPAEPLLEVAPTIPTAPPAITTTAAPMARGLLSLRVSICDLLRVHLPQPGC